MTDASPFSPTLLRTWVSYRQCAARSATLAGQLQRARLCVALLTTGGAVLGTAAVSFTFGGEITAAAPWLARAAGGASAICLSLAAVVTHHVLQTNFERERVLLRSMAEGLKSEAFKYMAKAPPYDGYDSDDRLAARTQEILGDGIPGEPIQLSETAKVKNLPSNWLTAEDYVAVRVREQIEGYYRPRAVKNAAVVARIRLSAIGLGALGAILGGIAAFDPDATWTAAWVAVVSTVSAAVGTYLYAGRFQYLTTSYDLTALRLEWLIDDWERLKRKTPQASPAGFVLACENAISVENSTWVAEWTKKVKRQSPAGTTQD